MIIIVIVVIAVIIPIVVIPDVPDQSCTRESPDAHPCNLSTAEWNAARAATLSWMLPKHNYLYRDCKEDEVSIHWWLVCFTQFCDQGSDRVCWSQHQKAGDGRLKPGVLVRSQPGAGTIRGPAAGPSKWMGREVRCSLLCTFFPRAATQAHAWLSSK